MKFFDYFKKKKEPEERSCYCDSLFYNGRNGYSEHKALLLSAVFRCVEVISDSIAQLPLEPYRIDSEGYKYLYKNHPTYLLLNKEPNQNMSRFTFLKTMAVSMLLTGNAYAYIERDEKGNAKALYYLPSSCVSINYPKTIKDRVSYNVSGIKGVVDSINMIHILNFTHDGYLGVSTLAYARKTLGLATNAEDNAEGFFRGGANVAGILKANAPLSQKQKDNLKASWNSAFSGCDGTPNGVAVLDADLSFQAVQINPSDSQLLETREFNVVDICRFFGVSPVKAFDLTKSSYNTIEQLQLAFLTDTLQPLLEKFESEFERKLFKPSEKNNVEVRFNTAVLLRADKNSLASYYRELFNIGAITPNEIRKDIDLSPVEGGDNAFLQVNINTMDSIVNKEKPEDKEDEL